MARSSRSKSTPAPNAAEAPPDSPESPQAQNIWLAGLGAFASAQAEGSKAFEALVKEGLEMQSRTQTLAKERMAEAVQRMEHMTAQATGGGASAPWDRLGGIFEERVGRALARMGMPTASELAALAARVEALERQLQQTGAPSATADKPAGTRASRKRAAS